MVLAHLQFKVTKTFSEWKQVHVGIEPSKTNLGMMPHYLLQRFCMIVILCHYHLQRNATEKQARASKDSLMPHAAMHSYPGRVGGETRPGIDCLHGHFRYISINCNFYVDCPGAIIYGQNIRKQYRCFHD